MIFRLTVSVRSLDWWSQGSTMHTTTWETTMLMCSRRKLQTRCLFRLNQNWLPHSQIAENQPGTLLVTIDSKKLSANIESPSLIVQQHSDGILLTGLPRYFAWFNIFVTIQASGDRGTKARFDLSMTKSPLPVPLLSFTRRFTGLAFLYCTASL